MLTLDDLEKRLQRQLKAVEQTRERLKAFTGNDAEDAQAQRDLVRRLRLGAWMSANELEDRSDLGKGACAAFETKHRPLTPGDRQKMVAMLETLLVCRRGYAESLKQWRAETGISTRQAGFVIGCSKFIVLKIERDDFVKWPSQQVRDSMDRVLTEWERSKEPQQLARAS